MSARTVVSSATKDVVISISGNSVIIKKITVPMMKPEELAANIRNEAEHHIPFGRDDVDEPFGEGIQSIGLRDVAVERGRIELREHEDAADLCVQAEADRHVDQTVLATNRYCRLRPGGGERKQTAALAAAHDDAHDVAGVGRNLRLDEYDIEHDWSPMERQWSLRHDAPKRNRPR